MDVTIIKDQYFFSCMMCGECCTGKTDIYLNLYDLYKLCNYLKVDYTGDLFERGLVKPAIIENGSWIPRIQFRKKPFSFCPFLINNMDENFKLECYCRLHSYFKPLACRMAPVGRIIDCSAEETRYVLISPAAECPGMKSLDLCKIADLENELKHELEYDYRFFMILDAIINATEWTEKVTEKLYYFSTAGSFITILEKLENQYRASSVV
ncbi:MAG: hypothetical protein JXB88_01435 [Spirochaetales bacterium]|nr:hypothetical protein [Spirochaetales bacterium]